MRPDRHLRLEDTFYNLLAWPIGIVVCATMIGVILWLLGDVWIYFDEESAVAAWCLNVSPYAFLPLGIALGLFLGLVIPGLILYHLGRNIFFAYRRTTEQTRRGATKGNVMWLLRFLVYCAGWVAFSVSLGALVITWFTVFISDSCPWWLLGLLGHPVEVGDELWTWSQHPWRSTVHLVLLAVLALLTVAIGKLHVRFAKRHGFRHPFCDNTPEIRKVEGVRVDHEGQKYYVTRAEYLQGGEPLSYTVERLTNEGVRDVTLLLPEEVPDAKAQEILEHSRKPLDRIRGSAAKIAYIDKHADDEMKHKLWRGKTTVNHEYRKLKKAEVRQGRSKRGAQAMMPKTRPNKHPAEDFYRETRDARASQSGKVHLTTFEPPSPAAESPKPKPRP